MDPTVVRISGWPVNNPSVTVFRGTILAINTSYKGPDIEVPPGYALSIKAAPDNAPGSFVFLAGTAAAVLNVNSRWPMVPNETINWFVNNATCIYYSGDTANTAVIFAVEKVFKSGGIY